MRTVGGPEKAKAPGVTPYKLLIPFKCAAGPDAIACGTQPGEADLSHGAGGGWARRHSPLHVASVGTRSCKPGSLYRELVRRTE